MKFLIPILVGAIIGYITNWLAIKMLFRPLEEKRIFGLKIPFTPGLIPKERNRIAKSVGEAVGEHILAPDVIAKAIYNDLSNEKLNSWIMDKYNSFKNDSQSMNDMIKTEDKVKIYNLIVLVSKDITDSIFNQIHNSNLKERAVDYIISQSDILLKSVETKEYINKIIIGEIHKIKNDHRKIKDVLSQDSIDNINNILEKNKTNIGNNVKAIFDDSNVQNKLNDSVSRLVEQNISKVITMFISADQISEKILQVVEKYINDPKSNDDYIMLIKNGLNSLLDKELSDVIDQLEPLINEDKINNISSYLIEEIKMTEFSEKLSYKLDNLINSGIIRDEIEGVIKDILVDILNKPFSLLLERLDEDLIKELITLLRSIFDQVMVNELPVLIDYFDVSKIVEDQINGYDVKYTEELILDIANKELKAITWLGALLGAIMGILTPLLQMLQ
ncbi:DUF445 family protein [Tissierella sp. Yu-01]|uniref:DUF445 family protein n=1 Tax=Tissierella sp. Yu-01 TaxID=3035694 RepID=UPI00240D54ED|nr:DUF445 family protein [Tissierella sp. Yu-01]WFA07954.1 DUF445 family protein [Tissierella sp. Yu-01]